MLTTAGPAGGALLSLRYLERALPAGEQGAALLDHEEAAAGPVPAVRVIGRWGMDRDEGQETADATSLALCLTVEEGKERCAEWAGQGQGSFSGD